MAGGLLNIVSCNTSSLIVFGNPKKFISKCLQKYYELGMQRFRLDT